MNRKGIFGILLCLFCLLKYTEGITVYVNSSVAIDGNGTVSFPYKLMGSAFTFARKNNGTTIFLYPGTFREALIVGTNGTTLFLTGSGIGITNIMCNGGAVAMIQLIAGDILIGSDFTMRDCFSSSSSQYGILSTKAQLSLTRVSFFNFTTSSSSALTASLYLDGGTGTFDTISCIDNTVICIYLYVTSTRPTVTITNSLIANVKPIYNLATAAGIYCAVSCDLIVTYSNFVKNLGTIYVAAGNLTVNFTSFGGNSFGLNGATDMLGCGGSVTVTPNGINYFCGFDPNMWKSSCPTFTGIYPVRYDGCSVCRGENELKNCNGGCFTPLLTSQCTVKKTYYVGPSAASTGNGSYSSPYNLTYAISKVVYGDTIIVREGTYNLRRNFNFNGIAVRMVSEYAAPDKTFFISNNSLIPTLFFANNSESFDTIIEGITFGFFTNTLPSILLSNASPKFKTCVFQNIGNTGTGPTGTITAIDSYFEMEDCTFTGDSMTSLTNTLGASGIRIDVSSTSRYSDILLTRVRFMNCTGDGAIRGYANTTATCNNCYFMDNVWGVSNPTASALLFSAASQMIMNNCSFYSKNAATIKTIACASGSFPTGTYVQQTGNSFCGSTSSSTLNCNNWFPPTGNFSTQDNCTVCKGNNGNKDCLGNCFGYAKPDNFTGCCNLRDRDCAGKCNGFAVIDDYGTCCGNASFFDCEFRCNGSKINDYSVPEPICCFPAQQDCAHICFGYAVMDNFTTCCGNRSFFDCESRCNGTKKLDNSTVPKCCQVNQTDCFGICFGFAVVDNFTTCCGNRSFFDCENRCNGSKVTDISTPPRCCLPSDKDCAGVCFGFAVVDNFTTCCGNRSFFDCENRCNGTKKLDNSTVPQCCQVNQTDCFGICFGFAVVDNFTTCCGNRSFFDCEGRCNGSKVLDISSPPRCCLPSQKDCAGVCFGFAVVDDFGTCCGNRSFFDCENRCNGSKINDKSSPPLCCIPSDQDCAQICNGFHVMDNFSICCVNASRIDCSGMCNGTKTTDNSIPKLCCEENQKDCFGVCFGFGVVDNFTTCCINASKIDCSGRCNGTKTTDNSIPKLCCEENQKDCFGVCFGFGVVDNFTTCCENASKIDCSGRCNGTKTTDNSIPKLCCEENQKDCLGVCFGFAVVDNFTTCCSNASLLDCSGRCNGTKTTDNSFPKLCCEENQKDCFEICFGFGVFDNFTTCCINASKIDCSGRCNGTKTTDSSIPKLCCEENQKDCFGVCFGSGAVDNFTTCCLNTSIDCAGRCNGSSVVDIEHPPKCCNPVQKDCFEVCFGSGYMDNYTTCCVDEGHLDCSAKCNGTKVQDNSTPKLCCETNEQDCFGTCFGSARYDNFTTCCPFGVQIDCSGKCNGTKVTDYSGDCCELSDKDCTGKCFGSETCQVTTTSTGTTTTTTGTTTTATATTTTGTTATTTTATTSTQSAPTTTTTTTSTSSTSTSTDSGHIDNPTGSATNNSGTSLGNKWIYILVGAIALLLILILLIVIVVLAIKKRRKGRSQPASEFEMSNTKFFVDK